MTDRELKQKNLIRALKLGLVDWFKFFEEWKRYEIPNTDIASCVKFCSASR
jgi:hypothetical protein